MRRSKKLLAMLLVLCMVVALLPAYALAAAETKPSAMSEFSLGDPAAPYKLNIVNDADAKMVYEVKINGGTEEVTIDANSKLTVGINEGDKYQVTKIGNDNYKEENKTVSFLNEADGYTAVISNGFSHKLGDGFKTGEEYSYFLKDGSEYLGDVDSTSVSGKYFVPDSYKSYTVSLSSLSKSSATITFKDGNKTLGTIKASADFTTVSQAAVDAATPKLQAAGDEYFENNIKTGYNTGAPENREYVYAEFTGTYTPKSGCTNADVDYGVSGKYQIYVPLTKQITDVVDDLALGDITLTFTAKTVAKQGDLQFDLLNEERLKAIDDSIDANVLLKMLDTDLGKSLTAGLTGDDDAPALELNIDTITGLLRDENLKNIIGVEALDNMPKGFTATLTEVDKGDGLYEGLSYSIPMTGTMFLELDVDGILKDALDNTLYALVTGRLSEDVLALDLVLPVSVGQKFALKGVRAGQYELTISSPGEGWIPDSQYSSCTVDITDGGIVKDLGGGKHVYGKLALKTLAPKMLDMVGMSGCSWMLGLCTTVQNGSAKLFNQSGILVNHNKNHIEFTNADLVYNAENNEVQRVPIEGANFSLIDRDKFLALANTMLAMGRTAVNSIVGGISFDDLFNLTEKVENGEDEIEADQSLIDSLLVSILAMGENGELEGIDIPAILEATGDANGLVTFTPDNNVTLEKLCEAIDKAYAAIKDMVVNDEEEPEETPEPAEENIEQTAEQNQPAPRMAAPAAAAANDAEGGLGLDLGSMDLSAVIRVLGAVGDRDQVKAIEDFIDQLADLLGSEEDPTDPVIPPVDPDNPPVDPDNPPVEPDEPEDDPTEEIFSTLDVIIPILKEFGGDDIGYAVMNLIGVMEGKMPTGNYILIQTEVPEDHMRNPLMYTFKNTWNADEKAYHTYASIDLSGAMSDEQFAAFNEKLAKDYEQLQSIFSTLAAGADKGLGLMREFMGEDGGYNAGVVTDPIVDQIDALVQQIRERMAQPEEPAEEVVEEVAEEVVEEVAGEVVEEVAGEVVEEVAGEVADEIEEPAAPEYTIDDLKASLAKLVNQLLNTYIPKASVVSYAAGVVYKMTGDLFESEEEAAEVLSALAADPTLTFTSFNEKVEKLIKEGDFVVNGEVTSKWYYYNLSDDVFSNVTVSFHYVLSQLLPPELASVIERALADDFEETDEMVQQIVEDITGQGTEEPDPAVPDVPDDSGGSGDPGNPGNPDNPDDTDDSGDSGAPVDPKPQENTATKIINIIKDTFTSIGKFFKR